MNRILELENRLNELNKNRIELINKLNELRKEQGNILRNQIMDDVLNTVCSEIGVDPKLIKSLRKRVGCREKEQVYARKLFTLFMADNYNYTLSQIARFINLSSSSSINYIKNIHDDLKYDKDLKIHYNNISNVICK